MTLHNECAHADECTNAPDSCYRCFDQALLERPSHRAFKRRQKKAQRAMSKKRTTTGRQFEEELAARLSVPPEAYRQPGSGNHWTRPGDDVFGPLLIEAKERAPINARGEKQITIKKAWLDKIMDEAKQSGRHGVVTYRHRSENEIYCVIGFDTFHRIAYDYMALEHELQKTKEQLKKTGGSA